MYPLLSPPLNHAKEMMSKDPRSCWRIVCWILFLEVCSAFQPLANSPLVFRHYQHHHHRKVPFRRKSWPMDSTTQEKESPRSIIYEATSSEQDLLQILELQRANLPNKLSSEEAEDQGFVTIEHDLPTLQALSGSYGHVVAKSGDTNIVVGYALIMLPEHGDLVPFLRPIMKEFENVPLDGKLVQDHKYCIMGQICIAKEFRGQGIFPGLYEKMKSILTTKETTADEGHDTAAQYDYIITGVHRRNMRSRRAHEKVGFVPLGGASQEKDEEHHQQYQNLVLRISKDSV